MTKTVAVPRSDAEVYETYFPLMKWLVARMHIDNVEDVAMELMERFIRKGHLKNFDPEHESGANFKTFFSNYVVSALWHFRERELLHNKRNPLSTDHVIQFRGDDGANESLLLDRLMWDEADTTSVEAQELIANVRKYLKDEPQILLFFEFVLIQAEDYGKLDADELADVFGVSRSTIYYWRNKLRKAFDACL